MLVCVCNAHHRCVFRCCYSGQLSKARCFAWYDKLMERVCSSCTDNQHATRAMHRVKCLWRHEYMWVLARPGMTESMKSVCRVFMHGDRHVMMAMHRKVEGWHEYMWVLVRCTAVHPAGCLAGMGVDDKIEYPAIPLQNVSTSTGCPPQLIQQYTSF
jgi:hypothetical protein